MTRTLLSFQLLPYTLSFSVFFFRFDFILYVVSLSWTLFSEFLYIIAQLEFLSFSVQLTYLLITRTITDQAGFSPISSLVTFVNSESIRKFLAHYCKTLVMEFIGIMNPKETKKWWNKWHLFLCKRKDRLSLACPEAWGVFGALVTLYLAVRIGVVAQSLAASVLPTICASSGQADLAAACRAEGLVSGDVHAQQVWRESGRWCCWWREELLERKQTPLWTWHGLERDSHIQESKFPLFSL